MKHLKNLGKVLNKQEQKQINGGGNCIPDPASRPGVPCLIGSQCNDKEDCHQSNFVDFLFLDVTCSNGYCITTDA